MINRKSRTKQSSDDFFNQSFAPSSQTAPPPPPPPPKMTMNAVSSSSAQPNIRNTRPTGSYYPTGAAAPKAAPTFYQTPEPTTKSDDEWYSVSAKPTTTTATTTTTTTTTSTSTAPTKSVASSYYGAPSVDSTANINSSTIPSGNPTQIPPAPLSANNNVNFVNFNNPSKKQDQSSFDKNESSNQLRQQSTDDEFFSGTMDSTVSSSTPSTGAPTYEDFDNEPPLMEELGINLEHITTRSRVVIVPFMKSSSIDISSMEDADMIGPVLFALLLGGELLLSGKFQFGYIYGLCMFGCLSLTLILNLMTPKEAISVWTVTSGLGYSLLPVNALAAINILFRVKNMGVVGLFAAALVIIWCTMASTRIFERGCGLRDQRYLVGYPCALFYSAFVMITIF